MEEGGGLLVCGLMLYRAKGSSLEGGGVRVCGIAVPYEEIESESILDVELPCEEGLLGFYKEEELVPVFWSVG